MPANYRFHRQIDLQHRDKVIRLRKKRRRKRSVGYISADENKFVSESKTYSLEEYCGLPNLEWRTLTRREADILALANPGKIPPKSLEELFPWLPQQVYRSDAFANFRTLKNVLKKYSAHFLTASEICDAKWSTICNSTGLKSQLDARFYSAWHLPIQDVFVLKEARPNRKVISVDVNAMYSKCMEGKFPKPSKLKQVVLNCEIRSTQSLPTGLYRCVLSKPRSEFIRKYNPFRTFFSGKYYAADLEEDIEVDLNEFELDYFLDHFSKVYIQDAVVAEKTISHPLAAEALRLYANRKHFLQFGNKPLANKEKFTANLLSSCSVRPGKLQKTFSCSDPAAAHLKNVYGIDLALEIPENISNGKDHFRGVSVRRKGEKFTVAGPKIDDGSACFLFHQRIVARGRVHILKIMEKIHAIPSSEICYVNVDSVHFSIQDAQLSNIERKLANYVSTEMGELKIEAVADKGLWLEPGRYWLTTNEVIKCKNQLIGTKMGEFTKRCTRVYNKKIGTYSIPIKTTVSLENSLSDKYQIVDEKEQNFVQQSLTQMGNGTSHCEKLTFLDENRDLDIPRKLEEFDALAIKF